MAHFSRSNGVTTIQRIIIIAIVIVAIGGVFFFTRPESTSTPANLLGSYIPPKITKKAIISRINDFKDRWWDPIFTNRPQTSTYGMGESPLD